MRVTRILTALCVVCATAVRGGGAEAVVQPRPALVPLPAEAHIDQGIFRLSRHTLILTDGDAEVQRIGEYLADILRRGTHWPIAVQKARGPHIPTGAILLSERNADPTLGAEGYQLVVTPATAVVRAPGPAGVFYGVQTLRQLLPPTIEQPELTAGREIDWTLPCVRITDRPRYEWRGMLLDCGRHFMDKEFVKRYIDLLAYHKLNVLHWHLTEDQGWRLEIEKYPLLTEIGAWRGEGENEYGGYYTQEDVREIVAYARERYVTIVPEIEMPGHCQAALAAYPQLSCTGGPFDVSTRWGVHADVYCAGNDEVFAFLEDVLTEVFTLFPSQYIHIGGDEVPKTRWQHCEKCQQRLAEENLANEAELQSYFIRRMEAFISGHGRKLIGWDEILEGGLAPNATVQSWRGMAGAIAAARAGHDVIASPTSHCYLDYPQSQDPDRPGYMGVITLETIYDFEPTPAELSPNEARHVLGVEGNVWTEHIVQDRVDWMTFPRLAALAEVAWSPRNRRNWPDFVQRLGAHNERLDGLGVTYFIAAPVCETQERAFAETMQVVLSTPQPNAQVRYTRDGGDPAAAGYIYRQPLLLNRTTELKAVSVLENGRVSEPAQWVFRRMQPLVPVVVEDPQVGLSYTYYEGDWDALPGFGALTPVRAGISAIVSAGLPHRADQFGFVFTGYVRIEQAGDYTFHLTSDDGSRLFIGAQPLIDNDGLHGAVTQSAPVRLEAGMHALRIEYFEKGGNESLELEYEGPDLPRRAVPGTHLFHSN